MTSVQVAVRVRPFNDREKKRKAKLIINMHGKTTSITDPESGKKKEFGFNYSYDSTDPKKPGYADQAMVFNDLGTFFLENAWQGFNCSIFAYGQTGAGKSYSMTGYGEAKGIIPLGIAELFRRVDANEDPNITFHVEVSYLEIYMENIRDLFNPHQKVPSLKVRESPKTGVFVQDLKKLVVKNYQDIDDLMEKGNKLRTVAATNMNATSSRSHSVLTVFFTQTKVDKDRGEANDMVSKINLIDLAGSERADSTGATGARLKEGSAINTSLTALGNVISSLADRAVAQAAWAEKHKKKPFKSKVIIPYRDSKLTRILQESLGGNAKTIMIAALSPADINYNETLSTLRYANRASKIKNQAVVNENPNEKLIRELKEEVQMLREALKNGGIVVQKAGGSAGPSEAEKELAKLKEELAAKSQYIEQMAMSPEQRAVAQSSDLEAANAAFQSMGITAGPVDRTRPQLVNLNEDPLMAESLVYYLADGDTKVGSAEGSTILLKGVQIKGEHAVVSTDSTGDANKITMKPIDGAVIFINGSKTSDEIDLQHGDRIIFGNNHFFRFSDPKEAQKEREKREKYFAEHPDEAPEMGAVLDFQYALKELAQNQSPALTGGSEDENQMQEMLAKMLPQVSEVNAMCEQLKKPIALELKLAKDYTQGKDKAKTIVVVNATDTKTGVKAQWSRDRFQDIMYSMKDWYINVTTYDQEPEGQEDPFVVKSEHQLIGLAHIYLESLVEAIDIQLHTPIVDYVGQQQGELEVVVVPLTADGQDINDELENEPDDWGDLGSRFDMRINIPSARGLPAALNEEVYVQYHFYQDEEMSQTEKCKTKTINPTFDYKRVVSVPSISQKFKNYLEQDELIMEVWGRPSSK